MWKVGVTVAPQFSFPLAVGQIQEVEYDLKPAIINEVEDAPILVFAGTMPAMLDISKMFGEGPTILPKRVSNDYTASQYVPSLGNVLALGEHPQQTFAS
jgi:hypothetical protein